VIVVFGAKRSIAAAMGVVGLFAIFHGRARATEMPKDVGVQPMRRVL
jgi:hydrogenase/urease accessory protein HupE